MLVDNHGRTINYMRLAVTDRCNLRCFYCMPENGIKYLPKKQLLSYEEMVRITAVFAKQGIKKIRITGGEPFLRNDMMDFLQTISEIPEIEQIHITTNGTLITNKIDALKKMGIKSINLSLDSLDRERFHKITRRDDLPLVLDTMHKMIEQNIDLKINMVVMANQNTEDIIPMLELAKSHPIVIRFIEEMPFNGSPEQGNERFWSHVDILEKIKSVYPNISKIPDPPYSTSANYKVDGFKGGFGIIAAFSRTFCGTCNRIRLTPMGIIKTCLYDNGIFNVRDMIRNNASDDDIVNALKSAIAHRAKDGHEAENRRKLNFPISESMSTIGG